MNLLYEEVLTIELSFIEKTVTFQQQLNFDYKGPLIILGILLVHKLKVKAIIFHYLFPIREVVINELCSLMLI